MINKRSSLIYALLLLVWGLIGAWQVMEHSHVVAGARQALIGRARDISTTLGLVIRSQRRFGGIVSQERLEPALKELVKSGDLQSMALLNQAGDVVASAGDQIDPVTSTLAPVGVHWDARFLTLVNPVELGQGSTAPGETNRPTIVLPPRNPTNSTRDEFGPPSDFRRSGSETANADKGNGQANENRRNRDREGGRERDKRGGRPFWMSEKEYEALLLNRGLHSVAIVMPTHSIEETSHQDVAMRTMIMAFSTLAFFGLGLAWTNQGKSAELQMRLVRASELNSHLKELNVVAAGLAHETKNPLNIIRGLAQMISKETQTSAEVRKRSLEITEEADRVTAQLNEFINYSRPRDVRWVPVPLQPVISDVVRALDCDLTEKGIQLGRAGEEIVIHADEQLLRQLLFNLLINATQALEPGGKIVVTIKRAAGDFAVLDIADDGPGVAADLRREIFKPYFTTHAKGTGLGLAIVQQIVLAHGWEIECLPNEPKGALFRVSRLKTLSST